MATLELRENDEVRFSEILSRHVKKVDPQGEYDFVIIQINGFFYVLQYYDEVLIELTLVNSPYSLVLKGTSYFFKTTENKCSMVYYIIHRCTESELDRQKIAQRQLVLETKEN